MSLFDLLVTEAMSHQRDLAPLRVVVEKELLHHDILREMSRAGLLKKLTLVGGTCLRLCYGSHRLSEDLDFTGGKDFNRESLARLATVLSVQLKKKYDLEVEVSEPVQESGNVDTWKLKVTTRPLQPHLPLQRIHIDICSIPSYDPQPMMLRNHYGVEMGTSGLILQAQSKEEILADKMVAFALRRNRMKSRDIWDIGWLTQQNAKLSEDLVWKKVQDHKQTPGAFRQCLTGRVQELRDNCQVNQDFVQEMRRFLPPQIVTETIQNIDFWKYLTGVVTEHADAILGGAAA